MGYSSPPLQPLQRQIAPSSYQHVSVGSVHAPVAADAIAGHAAGRGSVSRHSAAGRVTDHAPSEQSAVVRHCGRRSSPQLQSAAEKPTPEPELDPMQELPGVGGMLGQEALEAPPAPAPPTAAPAFPAAPACDAPLPPSPERPAAPPPWSVVLVPPPQASEVATGRSTPSEKRMMKPFCAFSIGLARCFGSWLLPCTRRDLNPTPCEPEPRSGMRLSLTPYALRAVGVRSAFRQWERVSRSSPQP